MERYMELCSYSTAGERARALGVDTAEVTDQVVWQRHRQVWDRLPSSLSYLRRAMTLDLGVYMPGLGLGYVDRAGMEFGVEIRVPWLDLELLRWSFTLRDELLVRRMSGKLLPKALARTVIPRAVVDRPKRGFGVPTGSLVATRAAGARGFRQGQYFANATSVLDQWMHTDRTSPKPQFAA